MIFIDFQGIKGNATAEGYENHIRVDSLNFGVGRAISMECGNMANREASRPSCSEVTFSHKTDNSATALFKEAVCGSQGKKVTIKFVQTGAESLTEYMTYVLEDVLVSAYSISAEGDTDPCEQVSLSYAKITVNYNDFDKSNKSASPQRVGYCLETGKPL